MNRLRLFSISIMLLLTTSIATAQPYYGTHAAGYTPAHRYSKGLPANEISFSLGVWPMRPNILFDDDDYRHEREAPFEVSMEYMRHLTRHFSMGLDLTYIPVLNDYWDDDYYYDNLDSRGYSRNSAFGKGGRYEESILVIMPTFRLEWLQTRNFTMYTRVALGLGMEFDKVEDRVNTGFTFQAVPIGMLIGRTVYARIEFPAFGYQGLLTAGIGYRF